MAASVHSLNSSDKYIHFFPIETFGCNCQLSPNKLENSIHVLQSIFAKIRYYKGKAAC